MRATRLSLILLLSFISSRLHILLFLLTVNDEGARGREDEHHPDKDESAKHVQGKGIEGEKKTMRLPGFLLFFSTSQLLDSLLYSCFLAAFGLEMGGGIEIWNLKVN